MSGFRTAGRKRRGERTWWALVRGAKRAEKTRRQSPAKGPTKNWQRATALARPGVAASKGKEGRERASERARESERVNGTPYEGQGEMNGTGEKIWLRVGGKMEQLLPPCLFGRL